MIPTSNSHASFIGFVMILVCAMFFAAPSATNTSNAAAGITGAATGIVDYGGYVIAQIPCTCTGVTYILVYDWNTYTVIPLSYIPAVSAIELDYNLWVPEVYTTGQFVPGFYGECEIYNGTSCNPLPTAGFFAPPPWQGYAAAGIPFAI